MPPTFSDAVLTKLLWMAATGQSAAAEAYMAFILKRGADLGPLRDALSSRLSPAFFAEVMTAVPWLETEAFRAPARTVADSVANVSLRQRLDQAGPGGLPKSEIANDADFADLVAIGHIVTYDLVTGGRPKVMACLRDHDPRFNPFAKPRE